jgi:hypothetical protein
MNESRNQSSTSSHPTRCSVILGTPALTSVCHAIQGYYIEAYHWRILLLSSAVNVLKISYYYILSTTIQLTSEHYTCEPRLCSSRRPIHVRLSSLIRLIDSFHWWMTVTRVQLREPTCDLKRICDRKRMTQICR